VGANGVANYLLVCIFNAHAEWKCIRQKAPLRPDTIKGRVASAGQHSMTEW